MLLQAPGPVKIKYQLCLFKGRMCFVWSALLFAPRANANFCLTKAVSFELFRALASAERGKTELPKEKNRLCVRVKEFR